jgi:hypothetical protein
MQCSLTGMHRALGQTSNGTSLFARLKSKIEFLPRDFARITVQDMWRLCHFIAINWAVVATEMLFRACIFCNIKFSGLPSFLLLYSLTADLLSLDLG